MADRKFITDVADQIADVLEDSGEFSVPFDGKAGITLTGADEFTGTATFEITDAECTEPGTYQVTVKRTGGPQ